MKTAPAWIVFAALGAACAASAVAQTPDPGRDGYKIVGYYVSWAAYGRGYTPRAIDAAKLTHINYAFAGIADGELVPGDSVADPTNFAELRRLKRENDTLKILISVGGWTGSKHMSDVALTEQSRRRFADSAVAFVREHGFDGIDIDWEYPVAGGMEGNIVRPEDKRNYSLLLQATRAALDEAGAADRRRYLLTIAAGASPDYIANTELAALAVFVDWINIMTYDFNGPWSKKSGHNAPLFADPADPSSSTVAGAVEDHLRAGVPAAKLVLGLPIYGRTWQGCAPADRGQYQFCAGPAKGTWEEGVLDYRDIAENYVTNQAFTRHFNEAAKVPFLFNPAIGQFISYDDAESFRHKLAFLKANGLGGVMCWELSADREGGLLDLLASELPRAGGR